MLLEVPVKPVTLTVKAAGETHEVRVYVDVFFSKWANRLEHFIPLIIPKPRPGNGDVKLDQLIDPKEVFKKLMDSYDKYAERVPKLREGLLKARKSYRFNLLFPVNTSLLEAEDLLVRELGIKEGAIRGLNLLLGVEEWALIDEVKVVSQSSLEYTLDELSLGRGKLSYIRGHMGKSRLMEELIMESEELRELLTDLA